MQTPGAYVPVGTGPSATGPGLGWQMHAKYYAKCPRCSDLISMDPDENATCRCGSLYKDADAGRFGSASASDDAIEIFRRA